MAQYFDPILLLFSKTKILLLLQLLLCLLLLLPRHSELGDEIRGKQEEFNSSFILCHPLLLAGDVQQISDWLNCFLCFPAGRGEGGCGRGMEREGWISQKAEGSSSVQQGGWPGGCKYRCKNTGLCESKENISRSPLEESLFSTKQNKCLFSSLKFLASVKRHDDFSASVVAQVIKAPILIIFFQILLLLSLLPHFSLLSLLSLPFLTLLPPNFLIFQFLLLILLIQGERVTAVVDSSERLANSGHYAVCSPHNSREKGEGSCWKNCVTGNKSLRLLF